MRRLVLLIALLLPFAGFAVQPDEVLPDAGQEARARQISQMLRCPVCQGENIDESNAPVSRDLRLYVRERIVAGDSDDQVIDAVVDRFGEFVLFQPRAQGGNLVLWLAGPVMLLLAAVLAWHFLRSRAQARPEEAQALSQAERERLDQIMRD